MKKGISNSSYLFLMVVVLIIIILSKAPMTFAYDVDGDGKEGLPESIHSLQVVAGLSPSSSSLVFVGNSSNTPTENGTALIAAMSNITDASSTKPYVLKLEPGIYDIGNSVLSMKEYIDVEGSGENVTTITSSHSSGTIGVNSATVAGADNAEIRFLKIENNGSGTYSIGLDNSSTALGMTNLSVVVTGGSTCIGIRNDNSSPSLTNVKIFSSCLNNNYGVYNSSSGSPQILNLAVSASGASNYNIGVYNSSTPVLSNVTLLASGGDKNFGIFNYSSSPKIISVNSNGIIITGRQLFVPASDSDADNGILLLSVGNEILGLGGDVAPSPTNRYIIKLDAGVYDLGANALQMTPYVDIEGSGENVTTISSVNSSGETNANSATVSGSDNAEIRFLTIENNGGSGSGSRSIAFFNGNASPTLTHVTAIASSEAITCFGVYNDASMPTISHGTISASNCSQNVGIFNTGNSTLEIKSSVIKGSDASIANNSTTDVARVIGSMLDGLIGGGILSCIGTYTSDYYLFGTDCGP